MLQGLQPRLLQPLQRGEPSFASPTSCPCRSSRPAQPGAEKCERSTLASPRRRTEALLRALCFTRRPHPATGFSAPPLGTARAASTRCTRRPSRHAARMPPTRCSCRSPRSPPASAMISCARAWTACACLLSSRLVPPLRAIPLTSKSSRRLSSRRSNYATVFCQRRRQARLHHEKLC